MGVDVPVGEGTGVFEGANVVGAAGVTVRVGGTRVATGFCVSWAMKVWAACV